MDVGILPDADAVAKWGAAIVADEARKATRTRGQFVFAVSGGTTPWQMLRALAHEQVPWERFHIVQVDERVAPEGDADRNLTHLRESLLSHAPIAENQIHAMPVNDPDLDKGAAQYARTLRELAGTPAVIDLLHLGLGADGHTASLVPGDAALDVSDADVAASGIYQGRRRLTLTYPILNRARRILWLVTGASKAEMFARLRDGDASIPAGRIAREQATLIVDRAAGGE